MDAQICCLDSRIMRIHRLFQKIFFFAFTQIKFMKKVLSFVINMCLHWFAKKLPRTYFTFLNPIIQISRPGIEPIESSVWN